MNRAERRRQKRDRNDLAAACSLGGRIPVMGQDNRVLALVRTEDLAHYRQAPNAKVEGGVIVLQELSDDSHRRGHRGNPRRYSSDREGPQNPRGVWNLRRLAPPTEEGEAFVQRIYRASVLDNLTKAA